jgi:hypothetical protein
MSSRSAGQRYNAILSGHARTVDVPCEWSTRPAQHYSSMSACLVGHDGTVCPHVLYTIMTQALCALETCEYVLKHVSLAAYVG